MSVQQQYEAWETGPATMQTYGELDRELSPVRLLACSDADRAQVARVLRRPVTADEVRAIVLAAATRAGREGHAAARGLRARPRSPHTVQTFTGVFNVPPTFVPLWRPANASWADLGDLVAVRLEAAARILVGGHMRFFCWGSVAHCPECTEPPTKYRACSSYRGSYRICLGQQWWDWSRDGRRGFMASTLLHEALHIYFHLEHHKATVGRPSVNNMYCYDTLVARLHRRRPKPGDAEKCAQGRTP